MKYKKLIKGEEFEYNYIIYSHITSMRLFNMPIKVDFYLYTTATKNDGAFLKNEDLWMANNKPTYKDAQYVKEITNTDLDLKLGKMFAQGFKEDEIYEEFLKFIK